MDSSLGQTETEHDALMAIRQAAVGFYSLAIIHFALGVLDPPYLFQETFSTLLYLVFAALLQTLKSRVLAWAMLVLTVANVVGTVAKMVAEHTICCYYLLIQLWASVRAVQGSSAWQKLQAARGERRPFTVETIGRWLVAGFFGFTGVTWVLGGVGYLTGAVKPVVGQEAARVVVSSLCLVGGLVLLVISGGIYSLRSWGRKLAIGMSGLFLSTVLLLPGSPLPRDIQIATVVFAAIGAFILMWLFHPRVKAAFRTSSGASGPPETP